MPKVSLKTLIHFSLVLIFVSSYNTEDVINPYAQHQCEPIKANLCQGLLYKSTLFPNFYNHITQAEAISEVNNFQSLVSVKCSPALRLFVCSLYFPVCPKVNIVNGTNSRTNSQTIRTKIPPCKSLCLAAKRGCERMLINFNHPWPERMNCDKFKDDQLCIKHTAIMTNETRKSSLTCPTQLKVHSKYEFSVKVNGQVLKDCGIPCDEFLFHDKNSRNLAWLWIGLWSCLCVASTLFTVFTFVIDMDRFQYPERPVIFISLCYLMISLTYVAGFILDERVSCSGPFRNTAKSTGSNDESPKLITQGTRFEPCIVLFMLLYFFSCASCIWWVILTITWYLAASCHWAHEAIAQKAHYFHFAAWAVPAGKTIAVILSGKVEGDYLSGVCFTGITDSNSLLFFLIIPFCIYLCIGCFFLVAGFVSLLHIRTIIKTQGSVRHKKLEKLIIRIGIYSVLYILPAVIILSIYFHEYVSHNDWMLRWYLDIARTKPYKSQLEASYQNITQMLRKNNRTKSSLMQPKFELFMIKYLMQLIVGITSGIWIWTGKTLFSWQRFFCRARFPQRTNNTDAMKWREGQCDFPLSLPVGMQQQQRMLPDNHMPLLNMHNNAESAVDHKLSFHNPNNKLPTMNSGADASWAACNSAVNLQPGHNLFKPSNVV